MRGLPVPHRLPEIDQAHVHCIDDAIWPSHPLTPSSLLSPIGLFATPLTPLSMDFPGKDTEADGHYFLQGIVPTQGLNPGLLHCRQIPYSLSYQGSPLLFSMASQSTSYLQMPWRRWPSPPSALLLRESVHPTELFPWL